MHWPQLPDPNGWDVKFSGTNVVADDWMCTETGPVTDIHFWFSSQHGNAFMITNVHLSIHSDIPAGQAAPWSMPGPLLWETELNPSEFDIRQYGGSSPQGWYDPATGQWYPAGDHYQTYQLNATNLPSPFIQQAGTIYWLDVSVQTMYGNLGWKTALTNLHFQDDSVWTTNYPPPPGLGWLPLEDPMRGNSLDQAFVITTIPEPGTLVLVGIAMGLLGLRIVRRKRLS